MGKHAVDKGWSESSGGLQVGLEGLSSAGHRVGERVNLTLAFRNTGHEPLRIYLINAEPFRCNQSTFTLLSPDRSGLLSVQPPPRPHGYVVTENDFHLIEGGRTVQFEQSLDLDETDLAELDEVILRWTYQNSVRQWPGGVVTLDGPTRALFDGEEIPFIWAGKVAVTVKLRLQR